MQVTSFAWINAKIEKTSTKDKFENYGFFCTILYIYMYHVVDAAEYIAVI